MKLSPITCFLPIKRNEKWEKPVLFNFWLGCYLPASCIIIIPGAPLKANKFHFISFSIINQLILSRTPLFNIFNFLIMFNSSNPDLNATKDVNLILIVFAGILFGFLTVSTIIGNLLVILSVVIDKTLRKPSSNYLIVSLSMSDLIVGFLIPIKATSQLAMRWPFPFGCWPIHELGVLTLQASILHLLLIAIDRYLTLKYTRYSLTRNTHRFLMMITFAWSISFIYTIMPHLGWHDPEYHQRNREFNCVGSIDPLYRLIGALITFYLPVPIIIALYWRIYKVSLEFPYFCLIFHYLCNLTENQKKRN